MNSTQAAPQPASMRLFIVEDSSAVLERILRSIADVPNVSVVGSAMDVAHAIVGLDELHPDALILDLHLPGGSGLDVLRSVRPSNPDMQVLVFTNFAAEPYRRAAMDAGADEFIDKNADFPKVREILARWSAAPRPQAQA
jgi:DNA-binding NarL/FixJ family response regulator